MKELAGEHTVILSTHILPEVVQVCEKVVIINAGRVVVEDMIENLTKGQTLEDVFLRAIAQEDSGEIVESAAVVEEAVK
jgi:ABC-2 type transport system ATP-binding protein